MNTQTIKEIQHYLRTLSFREPRIMPIVVDGKYGHDTAGAISSFQETVGLPVTGNTDPATWDSLVDTYRRELTVPIPLKVLQNKDSIINESSPRDTILILQTVLSSVTSDITSNGRYDIDTQDAVKSFQSLHDLTPTGTVDINTWNLLATLYNERRFLQDRLKE